MKARVKIGTLASDTGSGTECEVFGTEHEFHKHFTVLIQTAIADVDGKHADRVRALLLQGEFEEAFDLWNVKLRASLDTYAWDAHVVEVELSEELVSQG